MRAKHSTISAQITTTGDRPNAPHPGMNNCRNIAIIGRAPFTTQRLTHSHTYTHTTPISPSSFQYNADAASLPGTHDVRYLSHTKHPRPRSLLIDDPTVHYARVISPAASQYQHPRCLQITCTPRGKTTSADRRRDKVRSKHRRFALKQVELLRKPETPLLHAIADRPRDQKPSIQHSTFQKSALSRLGKCHLPFAIPRSSRVG